MTGVFSAHPQGTVVATKPCGMYPDGRSAPVLGHGSVIVYVAGAKLPEQREEKTVV